ncbi:uncharacterized protein LOC113272431 [Papaver somniferum]|uniref:uncharacterized protein LOC113272431 n=1 Tax=Papaver somniferum TaxID=3469 RepID=UPI000E6FEA53|nr:uncharacterized protein LOC113272431 [Papaver somniferum]
MDARYLLGRNVLSMNTKAKDGDSWIWKGILEGISNIQQHCSWRIGNGRRIQICKDVWLPNSTAKLQKPHRCPHYIYKLEALIIPDGNWDEAQISNIFIREEAAVILTVQTHPNEEDRMIWNINNIGVFSVKDLYQAKIDHLYRNDTPAGYWETIWNMEVAPVIKIFIWKCAHGILPTNAKTANILHYINPLCTVCNSGEEETMSHMFLNYTTTASVWQEILGTSHTLFDNNTIFIEWMNSWFQLGNTDCSIFATTCWYICKARCDFIFKQIQTYVGVITFRIRQYLCNHNRIHAVPNHILNNFPLLPEEAENTHAHYTWNAETGFGKHISICTIQDPENFVCYTSLTMTDFAGNIIGTRGHPGHYGEWGVTGGADLAFQWAKEMQHTNIAISAESMDILYRFKLLYNEASQGRFHLKYYEAGQSQEDTSTNMAINPISFVLLNLGIITRSQNMEAFNLAFFARTTLAD